MEPFIYAGELAALGTAVCWSATAVFFSYSGRLIGSDVVNRSRLLFAFLFLSLSHLLLEGSFFPWQAEGFRWFWLAVSSLLGLVVGDTLLFKAYVLIGPRLSMLLMSTVPIISTLFGWLLFGETVSGLELTAVFLTVGGVGWVVTEKQPGRTAVENKQISSGILFGLGGALGQVANLVTARYGLVGDFSPISATMIRILVALLVLWGVTIGQGQVRATLRQWRNRQAFPAMIGGSIAGPFLGIWLSLVAIQLTRLGIASTLMALPPVLLIPVEYVVYKKPVSVRQINDGNASVPTLVFPDGSTLTEPSTAVLRQKLESLGFTVPRPSLWQSLRDNPFYSIMGTAMLLFGLYDGNWVFALFGLALLGYAVISSRR